MKVIYLTDHGLAESYDPEFEKAFKWDVPLTLDQDHTILHPGIKAKDFGFFRLYGRQLVSELNSFKPDIVWIHGYGYLANWRTLLWAHNRAAVFYIGDSQLGDARSPVNKFIKYPLLKFFFARCTRIFTVSDKNADYYRHYGAKPVQLQNGILPIDFKRFDEAASRSQLLRNKYRSDLRIEACAVVVLFCGKMACHKRPQDLLAAVAQNKLNGGSKVHVVYVGDGAQKANLLAMSKTLGLDDQVHFVGFRNQEEIPAFYAMSDVLAICSEKEPYGLVVSEGLPFGLPVIASDAVGCVGPNSVARPNENALVYPCGDVEALAGAIERLARDKVLRNRMGQKSRRIAPTQDISAAADGVLRAWDQLQASA